MTTGMHNTDFSPSTAPVFDKTPLDSIHRPVDLNKWETVLDLFDEGKYKESLIALLEYVDRELVNKRGNPDRSEFVIPHGSIIVKLRIDKKNFYISAPFLKVPTTRYIPLLRQATQLNIYPLNLANIVLEDDLLIFKFSCPLELCEPYKIYDVMREICSYADSYDDEFIKKFGARWINKPVIKRFSGNLVDFTWQKTQNYLNEAAAFIDYFERKRLFAPCLDVIIITLLKIDYFAEPQGVLRTDIEKNISQLQNREVQPADRIRKGKQFLKHLQDYKKEEFANDLYVAEVFIPFKNNFTVDMIETYFQELYNTIKQKMAAREYMWVVFTLHDAFLTLFYQYIVPYNIRSVFTDSLLNASRKPWDEAASILWAALDKVMKSVDGKLEINKSKTKKGLLAKLFGREN